MQFNNMWGKPGDRRRWVNVCTRHWALAIARNAVNARPVSGNFSGKRVWATQIGAFTFSASYYAPGWTGWK